MGFLNYLATFRTDFGEGFWNTITKFGEETIIIVLLCVLYWCINKNMAYIVGFSFFLSGFLVQGLKITFRIERPWVLDTNFKAAESAYETATGYSFPSGHTQATTAVYTSLGLQVKNWMRYICFLIPLGVAFSRVYLGVHTPKDVITSLLLAVGISILVSYFLNKEDKIYVNIFLKIIILLAILLAVYSLILYTKEIIAYDYVSDCMKTASAGIGFALGVILERRFVNFDPKTCRISCQIYKVFLGVIGVLLIQVGLKEIFLLPIGDSVENNFHGYLLFVDFVRYMLITFWIAYIWPFIFTKLNKAKNI